MLWRMCSNRRVRETHHATERDMGLVRSTHRTRLTPEPPVRGLNKGESLGGGPVM